MSQTKPKGSTIIQEIIKTLQLSPDTASTQDAILDCKAKLIMFCKKDDPQQLIVLQQLINNKQFIGLINQHFMKFNKELIQTKIIAKKSPNYTFEHFIEILHSNHDIALIEFHTGYCLSLLMNIASNKHFMDKRSKIRVIIGQTLFDSISSILSHCKLFRLDLANKLFIFIGQMLPPINTSKSKKFCNKFNVSLLLNRISSFIKYRIQIDGDGNIDNNKNNYNDLYGIEMSLSVFMDYPITILIYFITSKLYKDLCLNNPQLTACVVVLCVRLSHEIREEFDLKFARSMEELFGNQNMFRECLNKMALSFNNNPDEYKMHCVIIQLCMEYLYWYSLERDIKLVQIPLYDYTFESFEESWSEYQVVIALIRWVTGNEYLGLYLDTIANQLGYCNVEINKKYKKKLKKPKASISYQSFADHNNICCFHIKCDKKFNKKDKKSYKKCSGCKAAYYCSKLCQKRDWKYHSKLCKKTDDNNNDNDPINICSNINCDVRDNLRRCTGCYNVWYCSIKCQTEDWKQHKTHCKQKRSEMKQKKNTQNN